MGSAHFTKAMQLLLRDSVVVRLIFVVVVLVYGACFTSFSVFLINPNMTNLAVALI